MWLFSKQTVEHVIAIARGIPARATVLSDINSYQWSEMGWDGVHPLTAGAKLTFETIANALLSIPIG